MMMMTVTAITSSNNSGTGTSAIQQAATATTWQHWQEPAIIKVCHKHAVVQPLNDGVGGTLQLQMKQV